MAEKIKRKPKKAVIKKPRFFQPDITKKKKSGGKPILPLSESRLLRVLSKIPPLYRGERDLDIEEYLVAKWREKTDKNKIDLFLDKLKVNDNKLAVWKKRLMGNLREFSHISFANPYPFYSVGAKTILAKKETIEKLSAKPRALKFATICFMALVISLSVVRTMPEQAGKYLRAADKIMLAPFFIVSKSTLAFLEVKFLYGQNYNKREFNRVAGNKAKVNTGRLAEYIVNHAQQFDPAISGGENTFLIKLEDLKGKIAGAEEEFGQVTAPPATSPTLYGSIMADAKSLLIVIGRWLDQTVK